MHDVYFPNSRDVYEAGFKLVDVPLLDEGAIRPSTFYNRHGDWFGWSCVALSAGLAARHLVKRRGGRIAG
jgi:hypothetical protein